MKNKKKLMVEGKIFEGISPILKKLVSGFLSGKIKKIAVSKENKSLANSFKELGKSLNDLNDFLKDHPEINQELEDKLGF